MKNFLNKAAYRFSRFMAGRYGADDLYKALVALYIVLAFAGIAAGRFSKIGYYVIFAAATAVIIFTFYRVFSKNIAARRSENAKWVSMKNKAQSSSRLVRDKWKFRKTHIFKKCPQCKAVLRLPKKKGSHNVVCPHCRKQFSVNVR